MQEDYFSLYLRYAGAGVTEPPTIYHRWSAISLVGALLSRSVYIPFGHSHLYPNQYINLMGAPGSRKSTAINIAVKLAKQVGYNKFAADKVSKERFLMDMGRVEDIEDVDELMNFTFDMPSECYVVAEEFTDFVGTGNLEFLTMLTKLWDNMDEYKQPKIHGSSVSVYKPTVNILAGNTPQNFAVAFPPEALGNGYMSRCLFIHGETTGRKVAFPGKPDPALAEALVERLRTMQQTMVGAIVISDEARAMLSDIYETFKELEDNRFLHYSTRRYTHLLKLCIICCCSELRMRVDAQDVVLANTMLTRAEHFMPKALGEYGRGKTSGQSAAVMEVLNKTLKPLNLNQIWKMVSRDFSKLAELIDVIKNLERAEKLQLVKIPNTKLSGYLPKNDVSDSWIGKYVREELLTEEERGL